jgi:transcriptional regulator with XRE-family HTH domain
MGRRERQLTPGPLRDFAHDLRKLRSDSGMTYRELARRAGYSASALSAAASGQALPTRDVLLAYVGACGAETKGWERRLDGLSAAGGDMSDQARDGDQQAPAAPGDAQPGNRHAEADGGLQPATITLGSNTAPAGPAIGGKRHLRPRPQVRLGLAPIILATAAIIAYAIVRATSPGTPQLQTQPPAKAPVIAPAGPSARPSQARPTLGTQPPGTAPATAPSRPATPPSQAQPATGAGAAPQAGGGPASQVPLIRFDFEQPAQQWFVFWGQQLAVGGITTDVAYRGTHSYLVTIDGATASRGYSAIGIAHGLAGLSPGMHVTVHLWSSDPGNTAVRFFAMNSQSAVAWAPENPGGDIPLPPGPGWSAMTWTIPAVDQVHAIGIQVYSGTSAPLRVAIDNVSW